MSRVHRAGAIALGVVLIGGVLAPPAQSRAHDGKHDHDHEPAAPAASKYPTGLILPEIDGPRPWSDAPHLNDPDRFHIAIMTDRTGGHRPGIWELGVEKVNLLRPEFVVSVGDLIEGYTEDEAEIGRQWDEFLGFIDRMEMKFFFVPGNHDLTNPVMHRIWREHFGREWYSFDYKGVHFVAINSEDPQQHIGEEQLSWLEEDLAAHADARWTLLFFHKPLWTYAEREMAAGNPDPTNWKRVEAMLGDRPHTVFSGHVHHYVQYDRNGMNYYHLATTGGGTRLRGVPYGEFDHVTWLTMEADGPRITHLLLDGVLAPDAVTEEGIGRFREFLTESSVQVAPILLTEGEGLGEGRIDVRLANEFDAPVSVSGRIEGLPLRGLTVDPATLDLAAGPGETAELAVRVAFAEPIPFEALAGTVFTATITSEGEGDEAPLKAEQSVPVVIDRGFELAPPERQIALDGRLDDWSELRNMLPEAPVVLGSSESWTGPGDAGLAFDVTLGEEMLYLAARVRDEAVVPGEDALEVLWDPRPMDRRTADPRYSRGGHRFRIPAPAEGRPSEGLEVSDRRGEPTVEGARAVSRRVEGGYEVELALPLSALAEAHEGADWSTFQLSAVVSDVDEPGGEPARILWRGTRDVDRSNARFGHFIRTPSTTPGEGR